MASRRTPPGFAARATDASPPIVPPPAAVAAPSPAAPNVSPVQQQPQQQQQPQSARTPRARRPPRGGGLAGDASPAEGDPPDGNSSARGSRGGRGRGSGRGGRGGGTTRVNCAPQDGDAVASAARVLADHDGEALAGLPHHHQQQQHRGGRGGGGQQSQRGRGGGSDRGVSSRGGGRGGGGRGGRGGAEVARGGFSNGNGPPGRGANASRGGGVSSPASDAAVLPLSIPPSPIPAAGSPSPTAAASSSPPAPAAAAAAPPAAPEKSRFAFRNGVFTLVTAEPLSDTGATGTTMATYGLGTTSAAAAAAKNGRAYDPLHGPLDASALAPVGTSGSSSGGGQSEEKSAEEIEEQKRAEADAWFNQSDPAAPNDDLFQHDPETARLMETIYRLQEGEVEGCEPITVQEASVLRYLAQRPDARVCGLLQDLTTTTTTAVVDPAASSPAAAVALAAFTSALPGIVSHHLTVESSCHAEQLSELEALQAIFGHVRELTVYQTQPITLKLTVVLQEFECNLELGFLLPACYPQEEAVRVRSFIPPPYQGMKIAVPTTNVPATAGGEGGVNSVGESTIDDLLQSALEARARELVGDASVYACLEEARRFMETHAAFLATSLEQAEASTSASASPPPPLVLAAATSSPALAAPLAASFVVTAADSCLSPAAPSSAAGVSSLRVLTLDSISIFGRGRIERLEYSAIRSVQEQCDLNESAAKAWLIREKWNAEEVIRKVNAATTTTASGVGAIGSLSLPPIRRQRSGSADGERFAAIQSTFAGYRSDPSATLTCSACFEEFQLREVAGHACGHVMCHLCWQRSLQSALRSGQIVGVQCVGYKCAYKVEEGLLLTLLSSSDYHRYRRFLQDSFIKLKNWRWCVNPRCDYVASVGSGDEYAVVACHCHALWCFTCGRDGHWPISCATSRAYEASNLVRDMRRKVEARIGVVKGVDDDIKIDVKKCPKCASLWERNGGCNHFKCGSCQHHFCWICLEDWATHGVSWFACVFVGRERKAETLVFGAGSILTGDFERMHRYCERELVHFLAVRRVMRILDELEALQDQQRTGSTVALASRAGDPIAFPPELPTLLADLQHPLPRLLAPVLTFLRESHAILRSSYILLTVHFRKFEVDPNRHRAPATKKLIYDLNQFEYFVDALDHTLIPMAHVRRSIRTVPMMLETCQAVSKYARIFAATLKFFQETELQREDEEETTKAFFAAIDASFAPIAS